MQCLQYIEKINNENTQIELNIIQGKPPLSKPSETDLDFKQSLPSGKNSKKGSLNELLAKKKLIYKNMNATKARLIR